MSRAIVVAIVGVCAGGALAQPSDFLLIPWGVGNPPTEGSGSIGMYSPQDGSYLGDIVPPDPDHIVFPNTAIIGPDRLIYLSDSVNDAVYRYDLHGNFVDQFLGPADGLDNVRGLHFLDGDLLVANNPILGGGLIDRDNVAVLRFGFDGTPKTPFVAPGSDVSAWDIHQAPSGTLLINNVDDLPRYTSRYATDGTPLGDIYQVGFPTQICDGHVPGSYYGLQFSGRVTVFTDNTVIRGFNLAGFANAGQGLYALGDGSLLAVNFNAGVYVHSATNGVRLRTIRTGFGLYGMAHLAHVCWADLTNDGGLDFSDVLAFLEAFASGASDADYAEPQGVFDFSDVLGFLGAFGKGCG
ncbi:MAG: GC-type dockerin domain-anchored protein [Phycisphaerales bacterium]